MSPGVPSGGEGSSLLYDEEESEAEGEDGRHISSPELLTDDWRRLEGLDSLRGLRHDPPRQQLRPPPGHRYWGH